jgi:polygalacturonase
MKNRIIILLLAFVFPVLNAQTTWTNVVTSGADRTGKVKCTETINKAIEKLSSEGGGTLYFPSGTFLTGPIIMKSNITLYFDAGATVKFSDDFDDYLPMVQSRWEDVRVKNFKSQIYAYQCENIAIKGRGHLDGQGKKWWDFMRTVASKQQPESKWQEIFKKENAGLLAKNSYLVARNNFLRPPMITTYECKNVLIEGISLSNPPFWTIMPAFTDDLTIEGITIENPSTSPNTDGIDPSSCRNVHISNSHFSVGDDCIVIKSGRDEDGREAARPTENITITNCTMLKGHGGVVIGSEMSGNVKRVTISNCVFDGTDRGIRIKTMRGRGGVIEDIIVSNVSMYNMVNEGVLITLRYQSSKPEPLSERTPSAKNIQINGVTVRGGDRPVAIYGLDEMAVSQIAFSDLQSSTKRGILLENANEISFHNVHMEIKEGPALDAKNSTGISYDRVTVVSAVQDQSMMKLSNVQNVRVTNCFQAENIPLFINEDEKCSDFYIMNNILTGTSDLVSKKGKNYFIDYNMIKK